MALQASGSISLSQINTELGRSSTANISLDTAEDGGHVAINQCSWYKPSSSNPAKVSEWYRYDHSATCRTVNIYASMGTANHTFNGGIYYKIGPNGSITYLGGVYSDTCTYIASITSIPQNAPVYLYSTNLTDGEYIHFIYGEGTTCPGNVDDTCSALVNVDFDYDIAITIYNFTGSPNLGGPRYCN